MDTPSLYIWIEKVQPMGCTFSQKVQTLWDKLPMCTQNKDYLADLCHAPQPPFVVAQRMTALGCFLQIVDEIYPVLLPHLTLQRDADRKPYAVIEGIDAPPLAFSLSHTQGMAVCALSIGHGGIGVDIESIMSCQRGASIADRFFTKGEKSWLGAQEHQDIGLGATRIWTAKEALFKSGGYGVLSECDTTARDRQKQIWWGSLADMDTVVSVCSSYPCYPLVLASPAPISFQKTDF